MTETVTPTKMKWYSIRVVNNKERKVKERIENEMKRYGMEKYVEDIFIPTERVAQVREGKKFEKTKLMYQGYIFIKADLNGEVMPILKKIDGFVQFIGDKGSATPVANKDMERLFEQYELNQSTFTLGYAIDETVSIIDGVFKGFNGKVSKISNEGKNVDVEVLIFGRITNVELSTTQIEKIKG